MRAFALIERRQAIRTQFGRLRGRRYAGQRACQLQVELFYEAHGLTVVCQRIKPAGNPHFAVEEFNLAHAAVILTADAQSCPQRVILIVPDVQQTPAGDKQQVLREVQARIEVGFEPAANFLSVCKSRRCADAPGVGY